MCGENVAHSFRIDAQSLKLWAKTRYISAETQYGIVCSLPKILVVLRPDFPTNLHASETHRTVIKLVQLLNFTYLKNITSPML